MLCSLRMTVLYFSAVIQLTTQVCFLLPEPLPCSFLSVIMETCYLCNLEEMSFQHENLHCGVWKSCSSLAVRSLENSTLTFKWTVKIIGCCWSSKLRMWIFYKGHFASSKKESWAFENPKLNLAAGANPVNINEKGYEKNYRGSIARYAMLPGMRAYKKKNSLRFSLLILSKSADLTLGWPGKPQ